MNTGNTPFHRIIMDPLDNGFIGKTAYAYMRGGSPSEEIVMRWCRNISAVLQKEGYWLYTAIHDTHVEPFTTDYPGLREVLHQAQLPETHAVAVVDLDCSWIPSPEWLKVVEKLINLTPAIQVFPILDLVEPATAAINYVKFARSRFPASGELDEPRHGQSPWTTFLKL